MSLAMVALQDCNREPAFVATFLAQGSILNWSDCLACPPPTTLMSSARSVLFPISLFCHIFWLGISIFTPNRPFALRRSKHESWQRDHQLLLHAILCSAISVMTHCTVFGMCTRENHLKSSPLCMGGVA